MQNSPGDRARSGVASARRADFEPPAFAQKRRRGRQARRDNQRDATFVSSLFIPVESFSFAEFGGSGTLAGHGV